MKRSYIKKVFGEFCKALDQNDFRKYDIMELNLKTCISNKGELFVLVEATIAQPGEDKSYKVGKVFDL